MAADASLRYVLRFMCDGWRSGSEPVAGQVCGNAGSCTVGSVGNAPACCQKSSSCYGGMPGTSEGLWYFQYNCQGASGSTKIPATCVNGTCVPE